MVVTQKPDNLKPSLAVRIDRESLRIFHAVGRHGSFNAAAKAVGATHTTVAKHVRDLEIRIGAQLVQSSRQGVSLTATGKLVWDRANTVEITVESLAELVVDYDKGDAGRIGISTPEGVASYWLTPSLAEFQRRYPKIQFSIDCGYFAEQGLRAQPDVWIDFTETTPPEMQATPLAYFHYVLCASRDYVDTYGVPIDLMDALAHHRLIQHAGQIFQPQGFDVPVDAVRALGAPALETNSSTQMLLACQHGVGIAPLPSAVAPFARNLVMLDAPRVSRATLWLRHRKDVARQGRIRRLTEWLHGIFDSTNQPWFREEYVPPSAFKLK